MRWPGGGVEHHPSHGDWVAVLRRNGFAVERLRELYATADATDHDFYGIATAALGSAVAGRGALGRSAGHCGGQRPRS